MAKTKSKASKTAQSPKTVKSVKAAKSVKVAGSLGKKSTRARKGPQRFIPGGSADVPQEIEDMVHTIACEAAKSAPLPMDPDAVSALRTALLPAMTAFVDAAHATAAKRGANEVTDQDFESVLKFYLDSKKK
eukprot:m.439095 g.439095  ORF g.439095 m.439095 type:complete len:132 (+) comp18331_c0_seq1:61-456(+)